MGAFLALLNKILAIAPTAVATAETAGALLASGVKSGASKRQAVMQVVLTGVGVVEGLDPAVAPDIELVRAGVGSIIDGIVSVMNAHKTHAANPAPVVAPVSSPASPAA